MDFRVDGKKVILVFGVQDIYKNTFLFPTHRAYIDFQFKKHGFEILKWNWDWNKETNHWEKIPDGLEFKSTDRQNDLQIEVIGTIGVNIKEIVNVESK